MESRLLYSVAFLSPIVIEQPEHIFSERDNSYEIASCQKRHAEVTQIPNKLKACQSPNHHEDSARKDAICREHHGVGGHEADVGLTIIVIANNRGKGEEGDGHRDEHRPIGANFLSQCRLSERDAIQPRHIIQSADKDDKGSTRAHQERVGKHAQSLDETLFHRMGNRGSGGDVWRTTLSRLIAEQPS